MDWKISSRFQNRNVTIRDLFTSKRVDFRVLCFLRHCCSSLMPLKIGKGRAFGRSICSAVAIRSILVFVHVRKVLIVARIHVGGSCFQPFRWLVVFGGRSPRGHRQ